MSKLSVFLDADVIFAGSAAPTAHSASHIILRLGEMTLIDCVTSTQAVTEVERNLADKLPGKLSEFRLIVSRSLGVVSDPQLKELHPYTGQADREGDIYIHTALNDRELYGGVYPNPHTRKSLR